MIYKIHFVKVFIKNVSIGTSRALRRNMSSPVFAATVNIRAQSMKAGPRPLLEKGVVRHSSGENGLFKHGLKQIYWLAKSQYLNEF